MLVGLTRINIKRKMWANKFKKSIILVFLFKSDNDTDKMNERISIKTARRGRIVDGRLQYREKLKARAQLAHP